MWRAACVGAAAIAGYPFYDTDLKLYYVDTEANRKCLQDIPSLQGQSFTPTPWLSHGIWQSYYGSSTGRITEEGKELHLIEYHRELVPMKDGGTISIDWAKDTHDLRANAPVLIIAHGITGGSNAPYIKRTVEVCAEHGYRVAVVQQRGINNTPLTVTD